MGHAHLLFFGRNQSRGRTRSASLGTSGTNEPATVVAVIHASRAWQWPGPFPSYQAPPAALPTLLCGAHLLPPFGRVHGGPSSPACSRIKLPCWSGCSPPGPRPGLAACPCKMLKPGSGMHRRARRPAPSVSLGFGAGPPEHRGAARRRLAHPAHSRQWATDPSPKSFGSGTSFAWGGPCPSPWREGLRGKARFLS